MIQNDFKVHVISFSVIFGNLYFLWEEQMYNLKSLLKKRSQVALVTDKLTNTFNDVFRFA